MNITKEQIDDLNAVLTINIDTADYQPKIETALKTLGKKVDLKGFRKGMVPAGLVKKMYGNQVLAEELDKLINESLNNYFKENELQVLGNPMPKEGKQQNIDINAPTSYEFVYDLGLAPKIDLGSYLGKKTTLTQYQIKPSAADLDKETENLRKRFGKVTTPDVPAVEDDVVYAQFQELDEAGNVKEGGVDHSSAFAVDMVTDKTAHDKLVGLKPGESVEVDIFAMMDKDRNDIAKQLLGLDAAAAEKVGDIFKLTLVRINRTAPADMDQEFFDKVFGKDEVKTEEEFRTKLEAEYTKAFANEGKRQFAQDLVEDFTESLNINLPDEFLKRWLLVSNEKPITPEQVEEGYPDFARNLKWQLIVNNISKDNEAVKVTPEDIKAETKAGIIQQFGQMQGFAMDDEQLNDWANEMMANKEHVQRTYEYLTEQKLIEYIKDKITVNEKEITLDDFKNLK